MPNPFLTAITAAFDQLEETLETLGEVERGADSLAFTPSASSQVWLFSVHHTLQQLWLASPVSGAWHYTLEAGQWHNTRGRASLAEIVAQELGVAL
jgi:frataxin-like iron-binding protein CyaY